MQPAQKQLVLFLKDQEREFQSLAHKVFKSPGPRGVHRLRICLRRLRSSLWILKRSAAGVAAKKLNHELRSLGRKLGEIRELDVGIKDAKFYGLKVKSLEEKRKGLARSLSGQLTPSRQKKIQREIKELIADVERDGELDVSTATGNLRARLAKWNGKDVREGPDLHKLRIDLKKARYALEALGKPVGPLKDIQDVLGRAHDLEVLEELCGKAGAVRDARDAAGEKAVHLAHLAIRFADAELKRESPAAPRVI